MKEEKKKEKSRASMIIDGDIEPGPGEKYLLNLRKRVPFDKMDPEKHREIARKGQAAMRELHGEKKTARQSLESILTLKATEEIMTAADIDPKVSEKLRRDNPNATIYDLIQAVAVGKALDGSIRAAEYVRDTHGDKPVDRHEISADIMTDQDRNLLETINQRLESGDHIEIVRDIPADDPAGDNKE